MKSGHLLKSFVFIIGLLGSTVSFAQLNDTNDEAKKFDWSKFSVGGGLILNFSNQGYVLGATPEVLYAFTDRFRAGVSATYIYSKRPYRLVTGEIVNFQNKVYGGSLIGRYKILETGFIQAEYAQNNVRDVFSQDGGSRVWVPSMLIGGGYLLSVGGSSGLILSALWDVIDDRRSPYVNPIIRVSFVSSF